MTTLTMQMLRDSIKKVGLEPTHYLVIGLLSLPEFNEQMEAHGLRPIDPNIDTQMGPYLLKFEVMEGIYKVAIPPVWTFPAWTFPG